MVLYNIINSWQALSFESNTELSCQPVGFARIGYESEFTRICSYKHPSLQIDHERFNGVLYKLWSHLWSDQYFPM